MERNKNIVNINMKTELTTFPDFYGQRYKDTIPDTLDLARRAEIAVKGFVGMSEKDHNYEQLWLGGFDKNGPVMLHDVNDWCEAKLWGPEMQLRSIVGGGYCTEAAHNHMLSLRQMQGPDGGLYETTVGRPWVKDFGFGGDTYEDDQGDYFISCMNGRYVEAALSYWQITKDDSWFELAKKGVEKYMSLLTCKGDYGYFAQSGIYPLGVETKKDAPHPPRSVNHAAVWDCMGALSLYKFYKHPDIPEFINRCARFLIDHSNLFEENGRFGISHIDHGHQLEHFHLNLLVRLFLFEAGVALDNDEYIDLAVKGYKYARENGETLMGFFPETVRFDGENPYTTCEICEVADIIHLGIRMSQEGILDCWDDMDRWVRNMFTEGQVLDTSWMDEYFNNHSKGKESRFDNATYKTYENAAQRMLGNWAGWIGPNQQKLVNHGEHFPFIMNCCTGNASNQLYRIYRDMAAYDEKDNLLTIHLHLNKAMQECDIKSYNPNQGKLEIEMKTDSKLKIRMPEWCKEKDCKIYMDEIDINFEVEGRYLLVDCIKGNTLTMTYPIKEENKILNIMNKDWEVVVRGNTIVKILPEGKYGKIFDHPNYRTDKPKMIEVERYIHPVIIKS